MFEKIKNKLFPRIVEAKYHYDDSLLFIIQMETKEFFKEAEWFGGKFQK